MRDGIRVWRRRARAVLVGVLAAQHQHQHNHGFTCVDARSHRRFVAPGAAGRRSARIGQPDHGSGPGDAFAERAAVRDHRADGPVDHHDPGAEDTATGAGDR